MWSRKIITAPQNYKNSRPLRSQCSISLCLCTCFQIEIWSASKFIFTLPSILVLFLKPVAVKNFWVVPRMRQKYNFLIIYHMGSTLKNATVFIFLILYVIHAQDQSWFDYSMDTFNAGQTRGDLIHCLFLRFFLIAQEQYAKSKNGSFTQHFNLLILYKIFTQNHCFELWNSIHLWAVAQNYNLNQ
jgi:hypothetical protein